jgi:23S rRNA pseudouridine2605 synthase
MYAGLTKKNVERSKWRYLSDKEIRLLKYMNESKKKKNTNAATDSPVTDVEAPVTKPVAKKASAATPAPEKKMFKADKEPKKVQPRKFKTHSEKKEFAKTGVKRKK